MFKNLLILLLISITSILNAQTSTEKDLELIETPEQIDSYLENKKSKKNKLITFNEEKHKNTLAKDLFKLPKGGVKTVKTEFDQTFYKVIEKKETLYYRVSYIAIDGKENDLTNINLLRTKIIDKYNDGASFDFLAKQYSSDKNTNKGGDSGWFSQSESNSNFKEAIINDTHSLNDIFTMDDASKNKYYVVLKTFEPKTISEIKVLKIVETIN